MYNDCFNCGAEMDLEAYKIHDEYVYWWECPKCLRVYTFDRKTLLFIKDEV